MHTLTQENLTEILDALEASNRFIETYMSSTPISPLKSTLKEAVCLNKCKIAKYRQYEVAEVAKV